jgi:hypothetical protein
LADVRSPARSNFDRREYEAEKRDALTKWDAKLAEMVA